ncbi:MAG: hypothetical protein OQK73_11360 [Gammaproteobacteria bacterium]|nr:hypothetical protein [Gammaproteobacteria bacterium]
MKSNISGVTAAVVLGLGVMQNSQAVENIEFSGYFTLKGTYADNQQASNTSTTAGYGNGYADDRVNWDTRDTRIGLQATAEVTPKLDMTLVMQANGGSNDQYDLAATWGYAGYSISDTLTLRMGKVKGPFYMVSDYIEVGYAYPWVTPPQEVYSTNPMKSLTGLDLVYNESFGNMNFLFELYTGSGNHKATILPTYANHDSAFPSTSQYSVGDVVSFSTHDMYGFNTSIGTDGITFRLGYFTTQVVAAAFGITSADNVSGSFGGAGLIVDWRNLVIYSEYIQRDTDAALEAAFPDQDAYYFTLGYRFGDFLPYMTYANLDKGKDNSVYASIQSSVALGFRYEVGDTSAVKFEALQAKTDSDSGDNGKYGLFDYPVKDNEGNVFAVSYDLIF